MAEIKKLKEQNGPDLWVHGSGYLIQSLLATHLVDSTHLWIFPLTVGSGKRLFAEGTQAQEFKLIDSRTSSTGVIIATYELEGLLKTGPFAPERPSEEELARRKRMREGIW